MGSIWVGIVSIFIGSFLNYTGIILQKKQVNQLKAEKPNEESPDELRIYLKDKVWILGILMQTILCMPFLLFGLQILGITLAQPLANGCVVFLVIGAVLILKEKLTEIEYGGIFILIVGMILIGFGGVSGEITIALIAESATIRKLVFFILLLLFGVIFLHFLIKKVRSLVIACYGLMAGIFYTFVSISLQIFSIALMAISVKGVLFFVFFAIVGFVSGTVFAIYATQEGFKRGQAMQFIPFSQITMNLLPVIAGLWIFQQVVYNTTLYWVGMCLIITGASLVARFQK